MSFVKKWQNSVNCSQNPSICSKNAETLSCKYLGHNLDDPNHHTVCKELNEKQPKSRIRLDCKGYKSKTRSNVEPDSVGAAIGLTCSRAPLARRCACLEEELHASTIAQDYATYLKAFALIYVLPEEEWRTDNIDKLLVEGEELFQTSSEDTADGPQHKSSAYTSIEQHIKRSFKLEGHDFTLELRPPYLGNEDEAVDLRPKHIMKNLKQVLHSFFQNAHYCLLLHKAGYLLIWRRRQLYFVMDVKGRRSNDLVSVRPGVAMLVCLQTLDNVVHLISNLSGDNPDGEFTIRELAVVRLVTPDGRTFLRDTNQRDLEYNVISNDYAYLKSNLHLSLNPEAAVRNYCSIIVGVAGILASHIDHPASWNTNMFDRLICYGVELCRSCWGANVKDRLPISLDKFPTQLRLGQFVAEIKLMPEVANGQWRCGLTYQGNDFEYEIRHILRDFGNALFQINNQMYALWCKDNFYYLLDPYRHIVVSQKASKDGTKSDKCATVRMFRDLTTMLNVFHQLLKESNRHSIFYIHVLRIKNIEKCPQGFALKPTPEDAYCVVKQLNEPIDFPQQLGNCDKLLVEISDYEPDVISRTEDTMLFTIDTPPSEEDEESEDGFLEQVEVEIIMPAKQDTKTKPPSAKPSTKRQPSPGKKQVTLTKEKPGSVSTNVEPVPMAQLRNKRKSVPAMGSKPMEIAPVSKKETEIKAPGRKESIEVLQHGEKPLAERKAPAKGTKVPQPVKTPLTECKFSELEAKLCARYRPINVRQLRLDNCCRCQCSRYTTNQRKTDDASTSCPPVKVTQNRHHLEGGAETASISYPVYTKYPHNLAVAGSESGTVESLNRLLDSAFKVTNRVLTITPWGNYVVFKQPKQTRAAPTSVRFYVFDGCTCNIDRFRHLDLSNGTAGLLPFQTQFEVVCFMIDSRETKALRMLRSRMDQCSPQFDQFLVRGT
ncbi:uncharacterized protein ms(3)76Cc [Drosophila virilis]|uniref:Uncharacterized protein n=1 Tax=Drosophila virilis TaxID=7244 RepID=B4LD13_DROVI|nr:uncharacterized protein LOC6622898 [Drosophila virilis]EDW69894.1 uncharacterized protein Dvir_GJ13507 [Drosophila virilis]